MKRREFITLLGRNGDRRVRTASRTCSQGRDVDHIVTASINSRAK